MAATRLIAMHQNKGKSIKRCLKDRVDYVKNGEKTENEELISSYACDKETVDQEFLLAKQEYLRITGRKPKGDIIAYQIRQSFKPGEITPEEANKIGYELAMRFTKGNHAFIVATHTDRAHIHNHIIFNAVNLSCDKKFRDSWFIALALQKVSDIICLEHALSVIKPRKPSERDNHSPYHRESHRNALKDAIDKIIREKPNSYEEFLEKLKAAGYELKYGKHISVRGQRQNRFIRLRSLGDGYSEDDIKKRISNDIEPEPLPSIPNVKKHKGNWTQNPRGFDLLIDINKKMQEGKGKGYERWAKLYNVKQVSKALLYLQEHGIRDYKDLETKVKDSSDRFHSLSNTIKDKEEKLHEIATLKTHIINYAKTRDIYNEYRRLGYSPDYLEEHREEILLHEAAKDAFNTYKGKKMPKVKELSDEYQQILSEKKELYKEYKQVRKEMMNYQVAKQDIDRFLKMDEVEKRKELNIE